MRIPTSTYRIQFNPRFGFQQASFILPYLSDLGISHVYASPVFRARPSSAHGYDVTAPDQLNSELGTMEEFENLLSAVKDLGLRWLQDIVPNHMAFDSKNQMLMDVLENGKASMYYDHFDIDWNHPYESLKGRILAPFLGKFYAECLENGEIQLEYGQGGLRVRYYDLSFPVRIESYPRVFGYELKTLAANLGESHADLIKFRDIIDSLRSSLPTENRRERSEQVAFFKKLLWERYSTGGEIKAFVDENLRKFNGRKGNPESFNLLDELLSEQLFRLSFWKVAAEEINYRRFFNINELISVRVEDEQVFRTTHSLILKLVWQGHFDGLRIDHIDGLYDPTKYLRRLREATGECYLLVEKILQPDEELPRIWPVQGTTGYDFLNYVNGVFCERKNDKKFDTIYTKFIGRIINYEDLVADRKRLIIGRHMAGDIDRLALVLKDLSSRDRYARDISLYGLRRAFVEILALFPVYRTYISGRPYEQSDRSHIQDAIRRAGEANPALLLELNFIQRFLLLDFYDHLPEEEKEKWVQFVMMFQQLTGPLMAKGFEDTTLYIYNKLPSLNEVGGEPNKFGASPLEFHHFNKKRATRFPHTMNATSTHDTKRGEDVRARINVISELPEEWRRKVNIWRKINRTKKRFEEGKEIPDANDEYFLYQTLVGAFPFDEREYPEFIERVKAYIIKAVREAKVHTEWLKPDEQYEQFFTSFVEETLTPSTNNQFLSEFVPFQKKVAHYGVFNSLAQTLLKITCPGAPDFYQGSELWDLNLVDPDNRRAVDFELRAKYLNEIKRREKQDVLSLIRELISMKEDGRIKLFTIYRTLKARKEAKEVFESSEYMPLSVHGRHRNHVIAFARRRMDTWVISVAPRGFAALIAADGIPVGRKTWEDTSIKLPSGSPSVWRHAFTDKTLETRGFLEMSSICENFPLGLLVAQSAKPE